MPSARRVRLLFMVVLAIIITMLFFTSQMRSSQPKDARSFNSFWEKTMNGLENKNGGKAQVVMSGKGSPADLHVKDKDGDGSVDEDDEQAAKEMADRLKAAEQKAKDLANAKAPLKPDSPKEIVGVGSSAGGQKKKNRPKVPDAEDEDDKEETDEEHELEVTMNEIFKRSPVIIFSKTYCRFSKRAKGVLLEKYSIDPEPFVVELDQHPFGARIQAKLGEMTGRTTVPNIMINRKSVGGSDDIGELDARKTLIDTFKSMGGKRLTMKERFSGTSKDKEV